MAREMSLTPNSDISEIMGGVEQLLDISVATKDYIIREPGVTYETQTLIDLNQIDFDTLQSNLKPSTNILSSRNYERSSS